MEYKIPKFLSHPFQLLDMTFKAKVLVLPGDNAGPEVVAEALKVLNLINKTRNNVELEITNGLIGGAAIDAEGKEYGPII